MVAAHVDERPSIGFFPPLCEGVNIPSNLLSVNQHPNPYSSVCSTHLIEQMHQSDGMGRRALSVIHTTQESDMALVVRTVDVLTIPARRKVNS